MDNKISFEYEYIVCTIADGLNMLESGDIDIMFGIPIEDKNYYDIIVNNYFIQKEEFALFSNRDITVSNLEAIEEVNLGIVEEDNNAKWILEFFNAINVKVNIIYEENYEELEKLLNENKIDLMVDNAYKKTNYKKIYEFIGEEIYIAGNKNNREILNDIDNAIEEYGFSDKSPLTKLKNKYFNEENKKAILRVKILIIVFLIVFLIIIFSIVTPKIKKNKIKNKIKFRLDNDKYLLQYQPIYNPRNKKVVAFEGLLRLLDGNNNLISPYKFIPEIEDNDMLLDVSIWILRRAISDYKKIKSYENMKNENFYISINISLNEIENDYFLENAIKILKESNLGANKICLEIIERVKISNSDKIAENIRTLKSAGFKVAIDDFGVEYSNLDILKKLDADILKVDKNFVDGIGKDIIKSEIINFLSRVAQVGKQSLVLEGVEEEKQDLEIKKIENDSLYVQGYFYSKPIYIEDIVKIS